MSRYLILAGLLMVTGCSDPAAARLGAGTEMVVRVPKRPPGPPRPLGEGEYDIKEAIASKLVVMTVGDLHDVGMVPAGTRVRVVGDDRHAAIGPAQRDYPDSDGGVDRRVVRILVLDGPSAGIAGELPRNTLRPAP